MKVLMFIVFKHYFEHKFRNNDKPHERRMVMKIVIIGAVAGGTSAAAKARRNDENAEIKIFDMDYLIQGAVYLII